MKNILNFVPPKTMVSIKSKVLLSFLLILISSLAFNNKAMAQVPNLGVGDVAITSYYSDGGDRFSFVNLVPITANTEIFFSDQAWNGSALFTSSTSEGVIRWFTTTAIPLGTQVTITGLTASQGTATAVINSASGLNLSTSGDQIFAYQGPNTSPTFLTGLHYNFYVGPPATADADWDGASYNSTSITSSRKPPTLTTGTNAMRAGVEFDNGKLNCAGLPKTTKALALAYINDDANWVFDNDGLPTSATAGAFPSCPTYIGTPPPAILVTSFTGTTPSASNTVTFNLTLDMPIASLTPANFTTTVTGGMQSALVTNVAGSGTSWTVTVTAVGGSTGTVTCNFTNASVFVGNLPYASNAITINPVVAAPNLALGDIAITSYYSDNGDRFSFVNLVPLTANTEIFFSDKQWTGTALVGTGGSASDGIIKWLTTTAVPVGTQITISGITASQGTITSINNTAAGINLSTAGDQIFAFQGPSTSPTFLAGLHYNFLAGPPATDDANWDDGTLFAATSNTGSGRPPTLTTGTYAMRAGVEFDNGKLNCSGLPVATKALALAYINDDANWVFDDDGTSSTGGTYPSCALYFGTPPTPITVTSFTGTTPSASNTLTFNLTLDMPIASLTPANFTTTLSGGMQSALVTNVSGSGTSWTVTVTAVGGSTGTVTCNFTNASVLFSNLPYASNTITINPTIAAPNLALGDIAITSYFSDGGDRFSFVNLVPLVANTEIFFSDKQWNGTALGGTSTNDGIIKWVTTSAIPAGTQITITGIIASQGTITSIDNTAAGLNFSTSGDQIFAFQGPSTTPTFLAGLHYNFLAGPPATDDANWDDGTLFTAASTTGSGRPPTLTTGTYAMRAGVEFDNGKLDCSGLPKATKALALAYINDDANWVFDNDGLTIGAAFPACASFLVAAGPCWTLSSPAATTNQSVCVGVPIDTISYTVSGGITAGTFTPTLPTGLVASVTGGVLNITGTPTSSQALTSYWVSVATPASPTCTMDSVFAFDLTVIDLPAIIFTTNPSNGVCDANDPITIMSNAIGADTYAWNGNPGGSMDTTLSPVVPGVYSLTVSNTTTNCSYTDSIEIYVFTPQAFTSVTATPASICAGDSSTILAVPGITHGGPYCASNATSLVDTKIDTVTLNGVSTGTAPLNGGESYTDNSSVVIPVIAGFQYGLTVVKGDNNGGGTFAAWAKVFIDFDQNGTYDPSEEVMSVGAGAPTGPISSLITIDPNALNGATGMRVVLRESGTATSTTACGTYTYGETEDYTVFISGGVENTNPGFATIDWTPATSLNSVSGDSVIAQGLLATTMYTAIGTDPNGCTDTAMVTVTVNPAPAVMASMDTLICAGDTAMLSATGADVYTWEPGALMGDMVSVSPSATTSYVVTGTDTTSMCSWSDTVTVTIPDAFMVSGSATPMAICEGDSVNLMAVDSVAPLAPYCTSGGTNNADTHIDSTNINGTVTAPLPLTGGGTYTDNTAITIPVTAGTAFPISLTKGLTGTSTYTAWAKIYIDLDQNGVFDLPGEQFTSASAGGFGSGRFTVADNITIPTTALDGPTRMRIVLRETGTESLVTPCGTFTYGETEDYTVVISGGVPQPTYTWTWEAGTLAGAMQTVYPTADTTYVVTQTNTMTTCTATDSVMVTVNPLPTLALSASPIGVCDPNDPITIMSGATGAQAYTWNGTAGGMDTTLAPAVAGVYTVVATDTMSMCSATDSIEVYVYTPGSIDSLTATPVAICAGEDAVLQAFPAVMTDTTTYCASNATSLIDSKIDSVDINGIATFTAGGPTGPSEAYTDNTSVIVPVVAGTPFPLYVKNGNDDASVFAGYCKVFIDFNQDGDFADAGEEVYSFGPTTGWNTIPATNITIPTTAVNGPTRMRVVLRESGSATTTQACGTYTYGETEDYTLLVSGGVENTAAGMGLYTWTPSADLDMASGDSVVAQSLLTTTMFQAIGTDLNGCMDTAMVTINVNPAPNVVASADTTVCEGATATISATGADVYTWDPGALMGDMQMVSPATTTTYVVTGTDTMTTCDWSDSVTVTIPDPFYVVATGTVVPGTCYGDTVLLNAMDSIPAVTYCTSGATNTADTHIDSTNINGTVTAPLPLTTGGTYTDNTTITVPVTAGTAFPISITKGATPTSTYNSWVKVYIDLDQNGVFDLPGEEFTSATAGAFGSGRFTVTDNITIPVTALDGPTTMRIVLEETGIAANVEPCGTYAYGETEDYTLVISGGVAPIAYTWTWNPGALMGAMQTILPPTTDSTYIVTQTNTLTGCTATDTVMVSPASASGDLTQAMINNVSSMTGTSCDTTMQPNDGSAISYYDAACNIMAGVQEPVGGVSLGNVTTCVTVDPSVQNHNGQPYVRRWFDINPTTQGPADVTLYFTDEDFSTYNAGSGTYDTIATNAGGATTTQICITQVSGGPLGTGTPIVHGPLTATWDAVNMRWDVTFPVTGFSEFYCHTCNSTNVPLAVDYKTFTVTKQATSDLVEWTTTTEQNSDVFNVLRSADGQSFETIGSVNSKAINGTSTTDLSYSFVDESPQVGHNYYRLEQVDFDKNTNLSKVIDIIWGVDGSVVSIYPNPARDILNIDLSSNGIVQTEIKLLDMSGRVVKSILSQTVKGLNHMTLNLSDIATGVYGVQIFENNKLTHISKVRKN